MAYLWNINHLLSGMHIPVRPYPYGDMMNITEHNFTFHIKLPWKNPALSAKHRQPSLPVIDFHTVCRSKLGRTNGGFLTQGYPWIIHFNGIFPYNPSIFGFPHSRTPPNLYKFRATIGWRTTLLEFEGVFVQDLFIVKKDRTMKIPTKIVMIYLSNLPVHCILCLKTAYHNTSNNIYISDVSNM